LLKAQKIIPDLMILDLNMPFMNGLEVFELLKRDIALACISVIIFSTCSNSENQQRAKNLGAIDYIAKPPDYMTLKTLLLRLLSHAS
jgi:CheY-like chemotaxis protein